MLAGHLPFVWDQKGPTTDKIADEVKQFLAGKGVTPASAVSARGVRARERATASSGSSSTCRWPNGGDVVKAQVALNQLKATGDRDPKRPLSYANVRSRSRSAARRRALGVPSVDLPRAAAPTRPRRHRRPRRPGGGAKENFDLSTFYANDGALGDSDNNLIPDRVDVLLSADGDGTDGIVDLAARLGLESTGVVAADRQDRRRRSPRRRASRSSCSIGASHPLVDQLIKNDKWEAPVARSRAKG